MSISTTNVIGTMQGNTTDDSVELVDPKQGGIFIYISPQTVTTTGSDNWIYFSGPHGYRAGYRVSFGGTLPSGIVSTTSYYVLSTNLGSNRFQISASYEGSPLSLAAVGTFNARRSNDGGVFFDATGTSRPTSEIAGGSWMRQYDEAEGVNVMWFGLAGDGGTNDTPAFQTAYNAGYNAYNFPCLDFLMGNIALNRPNVLFRSESAIYRTNLATERGTRIFLQSAGVIFYTTGDITGSRFYGIQFNGSKVTSGNCRGIIIGKDSSLVTYQTAPYTNYSITPDHTVIKCSFEFMQFVGFQQEGWLGEDSGSMIISNCFSTGCLKDLSYLTTYRAALAVYGNDCFIEQCEFGAWGSNGKTSGSISLARFNITNMIWDSTNSVTTITTSLPHGFAVGDVVTLFGVTMATQNITMQRITLTVVTSTTFSTSLNLVSTYGLYTSGGTTLKNQPISINGITSANNAVITTASDITGLIIPGDKICVAEVSGSMAAINNVISTVIAATSNQITLDFDSHTYTATGVGGIVSVSLVVQFDSIAASVATGSPTTLVSNSSYANRLAAGDVITLNNSLLPAIDGQSVFISSVLNHVTTVFTAGLVTSSAGSSYSMAANGGIVTENATTLSIQNISNASSAIINFTAALPYKVGDTVTIFDVSTTSMYQINNKTVVITKVDNTLNTITVNLDTTNTALYSPYGSTANGIVVKNPILYINAIDYPSPNAAITVSTNEKGISPIAYNDGLTIRHLTGSGWTTINGSLPNPVNPNIMYSSSQTTITVSLDTFGKNFSSYIAKSAIISAQIRACGIGLFGRDAAGNAERNSSWITTSYGELCDAGIYIGQPNARVTECRADHCAGYGFIINDDQCQLSNCTSFDNGIAESATYDGFLITGGSKSSQLSNCLNYTDTTTPQGERYGFNDLSSPQPSAINTKTLFSNCKSYTPAKTTQAFSYFDPIGCGARTTENGPEFLLDSTTTPNVASWGMWVTGNTSATAITNFSNGFPGQVIFVRINDVFTTIQASANIVNKNGTTNWGQGNVFQYKLHNGVWYQVVDGGTILTQTSPPSAFATSGTATSLFGTITGVKTLPAYFFSPGKTIKARICGVYSNSASSSFKVNVVLGAAVIPATPTTALLAGASSARFVIELYITCLTITTISPPTLGSVLLDGSITYNTTSGNIISDAINNAGNAIPIDTTLSNLFDIMLTLAGTVATTIKPTIALLESVN